MSTLRNIYHATSLFLLVAFAAGGVLAPAMHRALHGYEWHASKTQDKARCDHSEHGTAYEVALSHLKVDHCSLCATKLSFSTNLAVAYDSFPVHPAYHSSNYRTLRSAVQQDPGIRGPPSQHGVLLG